MSSFFTGKDPRIVRKYRGHMEVIYENWKKQRIKLFFLYRKQDNNTLTALEAAEFLFEVSPFGYMILRNKKCQRCLVGAVGKIVIVIIIILVVKSERG